MHLLDFQYLQNRIRPKHRFFLFPLISAAIIKFNKKAINKALQFLQRSHQINDSSRQFSWNFSLAKPIDLQEIPFKFHSDLDLQVASVKSLTSNY